MIADGLKKGVVLKMGNGPRNFNRELRKTVEIDGIKLEVIVYEVGGEWALTIANERGIMTNWTDFFASAGEALATGLEAIESEGARAFDDIEGFEYLDELRE